jgi:hypothetical protein
VNRRLAITLVALVLAGAANVTGVVVSGEARPVQLHDTADLETLVDVEQKTLRTRYAFFLDLRRVAAGLPMVVTNDVIPADNVDGLADMLPVTDDDVDIPTPDQLERLMDLPGIEGELDTQDDTPIRQALIVPPREDDRRMVLLVDDRFALAIGEATLAEALTP